MPESDDKISAQMTEELNTTPERSRLMARVRQKDTPPELAVRGLVHGLGHRFRVGGSGSGVPGRPDLANRGRNWAIFVHGWHWHAHIGCSRWRLPKRNREFWRRKFAANRSRDRRVVEELETMGLRCLVVWERDLADSASICPNLESFLDDGRAT